MGFVGGLLGTAGGINGTGISGPQAAPIQKPVTNDQANAAYGTTNQGLAQQQAFVQALSAQNGIQNQSSVFNQLQNVANGQGPNPAQAQLQQATGQNVANQAALMAGQRGSSANAGLIARQAAQQGGNLQQQAVGQAATLQANQSLNALQGAGNLATNQVSNQAGALQGFNSTALNQQSNLLNGINGQNSAAVGAQSSVNAANAGLAGQTMTAQNNLLGNITGAAGSALHLASGGQVKMAEGGQAGNYVEQPQMSNDQWNSVAQAQPQATPVPAVTPTGNISTPGPKSAVGNFFHNNPMANSPAKLDGASMAGQTIGKGLGTALASIFSGGSAGKNSTPTPQSATQVADWMSNPYTSGTTETPSKSSADEAADMPTPKIDESLPMAKGGRVPALLSPGERKLTPDKVAKVAQGADPIKESKKVPGKPVVGGKKNSYANDIVPDKLAEGTIILPRSVTQSKNPHWAAKKFVEACMAKGGKFPAKKAK